MSVRRSSYVRSHQRSGTKGVKAHTRNMRYCCGYPMVKGVYCGRCGRGFEELMEMDRKQGY